MSYLDFQNDTIAAIATGMTQAGIGIIRISGPDAFVVAGKVFRAKNGRKVSEYASHTLHLGCIVDAESTTVQGKDSADPAGERSGMGSPSACSQGTEERAAEQSGSGSLSACSQGTEERGTEQSGMGSDYARRIDQVLLSVFRAPHSYTGEDTVEINCHGGLYLCRRILALVLKNGARLAEPGEFTKRAFINGRMDLSQAESVMDLIAANNEFAVKNSMEQLSGSVRDKVLTLRDSILHEIAYIEAALDDPEHYDLTGYPAELLEKTQGFLAEIERMLTISEDGRIRRDGIRTAILGKPNAGKSSILNLLSGHETAIVTDIAGTTRDAIEETVRFGELQLNLVDTAGIREATDAVEKIGVERARKIAADADLILYVVDSSVPFDENDREILAFLEAEKKQAVILYNKTDLSAAVTEEDLGNELDRIRNIKEAAGSAKPMTVSAGNYPVVPISAREGTGLAKLEETLNGLFLKGDVLLNEEVVLTNLRQITELSAAGESLRNVAAAIEDGMSEDFFSIDLTDAYRHLGFIIGEELSDDVVRRIFSEFCTGK